MTKANELPAMYFYIGQRLRERRIAQGMTQEELALKGKIIRTTLNQLESGKHRITIEHLYFLAQALGCQPGDLLPPLNKRVLMTREQAFIEFLNHDDQIMPDTEDGLS